MTLFNRLQIKNVPDLSCQTLSFYKQNTCNSQTSLRKDYSMFAIDTGFGFSTITAVLLCRNLPRCAALIWFGMISQ